MFTSCMEGALKLKGTNSRVTEAYYPQSNGRAERMVQNIKSAITKIAMGEEVEWDELLSVVVNAI